MHVRGASRIYLQLCSPAVFRRRLAAHARLPAAVTTATAAPVLSAKPLQRALCRFESKPSYSTWGQDRKACALAAGPSSAAAMLAHSSDIYDGVAVDAEQLPADPVEFSAALQTSLEVRKLFPTQAPQHAWHECRASHLISCAQSRTRAIRLVVTSRMTLPQEWISTGR